MNNDEMRSSAKYLYAQSNFPEKFNEWKLKKIQKILTDQMIGKNSGLDDDIYQKRARLDLEILLLEIDIGIQDINSLVPLCKYNFEKLIKSKK